MTLPIVHHADLVETTDPQCKLYTPNTLQIVNLSDPFQPLFDAHIPKDNTFLHPTAGQIYMTTRIPSSARPVKRPGYCPPAYRGKCGKSR